jgi:hypothetical protein
MPTTEKRTYPSGRDALILSMPKGTAKAKDVVVKALKLMGYTRNEQDDAWVHPTLTGSTPDATLSAALYSTLVKQEVVLKPDRGKIERGPKFAEALKAAKDRQKAREGQA